MISLDLEANSINLELKDGSFRIEVLSGQWEGLTGYLAFSQVPILAGMDSAKLVSVIERGSCKVESEKGIFLLTLDLPEQLAIKIKITDESIKLRNLKKQEDCFLNELHHVKEFLAHQQKSEQAQKEVLALRNIEKAQQKFREIMEEVDVATKQLNKKKSRMSKIDIDVERQEKELMRLKDDLNSSMTMREEVLRDLKMNRCEMRGPSRSTIIATFQKVLLTYKQKEKSWRLQIQKLKNSCSCNRRCPVHP